MGPPPDLSPPASPRGRPVLAPARHQRWKSPKELLLEALTDPSAGLGEPRPPDTGSVRTDLIEVFLSFARMLDQPHGRALRPLMTQCQRHPELYEEIQRRRGRSHGDRDPAAAAGSPLIAGAP